MILQTRVNILLLISNLATQVDADNFFKSINPDNLDLYKMRNIKNNWYLEAVLGRPDEFDELEYGLLYRGNFNAVQNFVNTVKEVIEFNIEYSIDFDPIIFVFTGNLDDEEKFYNKLIDNEA